MASSSRVSQLTGIALLVLAACAILNFVLIGAVFDGMPDFSRDGVKGTLADIDDNRGLLIFAIAFDMVGNVIALAAAGALYLLLQKRDRPLALVGALAMAVGSAVFMMGDVLAGTLAVLADDLASGGNEAQLLTTARAVGSAYNIVFPAALSLILVTTVAFGLAIARGVRTTSVGMDAVPAWAGWVGVASGILAGAGGWLGLAQEELGLIAAAGFVLNMVFLVAVGFELLHRPETEVEGVASMGGLAPSR